MRLMAMHTCPLLTKAAKNSFDATARGSTRCDHVEHATGKHVAQQCRFSVHSGV
jgi:hypothetical protein